MTTYPDRRRGITLAFGTALISGIAVFVNSYGVKSVPDATVYTTAKNLVAAALLLAFLGRSNTTPVPRRRLPALLVVAVVGGSVPFVLFFSGLAHASSTQAAFVHKTLLVWVAILAVPLLGERLRGVHYAAIGLLVVGQAALGGGLEGFRFGTGELMILAATLLWAVEVVIVKRLLTGIAPDLLAVTRMGLGVVLLAGWLAVTGRWSALTELSTTGWTWAALTGLLLAGYVATWYRALALAPAVDVTAVLVIAAVITALLNATVKGTVVTGPAVLGITMLLAGAALVTIARPHPVPA